MCFRRFPRYDLKTTLGIAEDATLENDQISDLDPQNWVWSPLPPLASKVSLAWGLKATIPLGMDMTPDDHGQR